MGKEKIGRPELVDILADKCDMTKVKATEVIATLLATIEKNVAKGNDVTIVGFGTFTSRSRAARTGRNPATGEALKIKASTSPAFKAGSGFKAAVNKPKKK